jgi:glycosyltransferase involved in cell wall biosynthesis
MGADGFTEAVRLLLHNPEFRAAMGRAAREDALKASWDEVFQNLYADYRELICPSSACNTGLLIHS